MDDGYELMLKYLDELPVGYTPLMAACKEQDAGLVKLLLEKKADPLAHDEDGFTCLHHLVRSSPVELTKLNYFHLPTVREVRERDQELLSIMKLFREKVKTSILKKVLMIGIGEDDDRAVKTAFAMAVKRSLFETASLLYPGKELKLDQLFSSFSSENPIVSLIKLDSVKFFTEFFYHNTSVEYEQMIGFSCKYAAVNIFKFLVAKKPLKFIKNLRITDQKMELDLLQLLVSSSPSPTKSEHSSDDIEGYFQDKYNHEIEQVLPITRYLVESGFPINKRENVVKVEKQTITDFDVEELFLDSDDEDEYVLETSSSDDEFESVDSDDEYDSVPRVAHPPMASALRSGYVVVVDYFYEKGGDLGSLPKPPKNFKKNVYNCSKYGFLSILKKLRSVSKRFGNNIFNRKYNLCTDDLPEVSCKGSWCEDSNLLHIACHYGRFSIVKWLVENDVDINQQNIRGQTPIDCAADFGKYEVVNYLVNRPGLNQKIRAKYKGNWKSARKRNKKLRPRGTKIDARNRKVKLHKFDIDKTVRTGGYESFYFS